MKCNTIIKIIDQIINMNYKSFENLNYSQENSEINLIINDIINNSDELIKRVNLFHREILRQLQNHLA